MTHSVSRERTQGQPGLVQGQCLPGLGGVLLILPAETDLISAGKACGWTAVGSDRCSGGSHGRQHWGQAL